MTFELPELLFGATRIAFGPQFLHLTCMQSGQVCTRLQWKRLWRAGGTAAEVASSSCRLNPARVELLQVEHIVKLLQGFVAHARLQFDGEAWLPGIATEARAALREEFGSATILAASVRAPGSLSHCRVPLAGSRGA